MLASFEFQIFTGSSLSLIRLSTLCFSLGLLGNFLYGLELNLTSRTPTTKNSHNLVLSLDVAHHLVGLDVQIPVALSVVHHGLAFFLVLGYHFLGNAHLPLSDIIQLKV